MSLLNEMLNDLSENKSKVKATPAVIAQKKPFFLTNLPRAASWMLGSVLLSLIILLIVHLLSSLTIPWGLGKPTKMSSHLPKAPALASNPANLTAGENQLKNKPTGLSTHARQSVLTSIPILKDASAVTDLNDKTNDLPATSPEFNKTYNNLTLKQWHDLELNKALEALDMGDEQQAVELFETILTRFPSSVEVRENLAAIWLSRGELDKALGVLEDGFTYAPVSLSLTIMKARILFEQDKAASALKLLRRFNPNIQAHPDYYGLLAAVLQALNQIDESGSIYKVLVKLEPSNSQYWLGYGIALENKKLHQQAAAAYQRATRGYDIDPDVRVFAESRLKFLQG